jgi:hypothetical protein
MGENKYVMKDDFKSSIIVKDEKSRDKFYLFEIEKGFVKQEEIVINVNSYPGDEDEGEQPKEVNVILTELANASNDHRFIADIFNILKERNFISLKPSALKDLNVAFPKYFEKLPEPEIVIKKENKTASVTPAIKSSPKPNAISGGSIYPFIGDSMKADREAAPSDWSPDDIAKKAQLEIARQKAEEQYQQQIRYIELQTKALQESKKPSEPVEDYKEQFDKLQIKKRSDELIGEKTDTDKSDKSIQTKVEKYERNYGIWTQFYNSPTNSVPSYSYGKLDYIIELVKGNPSYIYLVLKDLHNKYVLGIRTPDFLSFYSIFGEYFESYINSQKKS